MNRKVQMFTFLILGLLSISIYYSALSQGALVSDQLEVTKGSYVKGKYLYTNTTVNDLKLADITLSVEDIWNDSSTLLNLVNFKIRYDFAGEDDLFGSEELEFLEMTSLVFEHNRTTFLPAATLVAGNATYVTSADVTYLGKTSEMLNFTKTNVTINGDSYIFGDLDGSESYYSDVIGMMFAFALYNAVILIYHEYTPFAMNPVANVADTVNYVPTDGYVDELEPITTSEGKSYDCINVEYDDTFFFLMDDVDVVDCHYEAKTGLLIRSLERDTASNSQYEFLPSEVVIKTSFLPFPIAGFVMAIVALGLVVVVSRKKK